MAEDGSWPGIQAHGLLSTSALLDLYGITGAERSALMSVRRPQSVTMVRDGLPPAVVRDQKPMNDGALRKCLEDGLTPAQWYAMLNAKTFFWVSRDRLDRLLQARAYRRTAQLVLTVETRGLVEANRDRVRLCAINSGATLYAPQPRGASTFLPIAEFPHAEITAKRRGGDAVVELVVEGGVPAVAAHVLRVERVVGASPSVIWERQAC